MQLEAALIAIRDNAHVNQATSANAHSDLSTVYLAVRAWPDSATKRVLLRQMAAAIQSYRTAARQALTLRDLAENAVESMTGDPLPPLPITPVSSGPARLHMAITSTTPGLLPANGEFGRYLATEAMTLDESASAMIADVAATNETAISVMLGEITVACFRFAAGSAVATVEILQAAIPAGSLLIPRAPAVQDPTLSGITGTLAANR